MGVIAVVNQKGGAGKSTVAINLAACLASYGKRVLVIDADPQGTASTLLGEDIWSLNETMYDAMTGKIALTNLIRETEIKGLYIAPTNNTLSYAEDYLDKHPEGGYILKQEIEKLEGFDYIIIDSPPNLKIFTLNTLVACDMALVAVQAESAAVGGIILLQQLMDAVDETREVKIDRRYLINMYDSRANLCKQVDAALRELYGEAVFKTIIPRSIKFGECYGYGKPISLTAPESVGANAYNKLTEELTK
jgi:ATPases involved in chromosome partitioning